MGKDFSFLAYLCGNYWIGLATSLWIMGIYGKFHSYLMGNGFNGILITYLMVCGFESKRSDVHIPYVHIKHFTRLVRMHAVYVYRILQYLATCALRRCVYSLRIVYLKVSRYVRVL